MMRRFLIVLALAVCVVPAPVAVAQERSVFRIELYSLTSGTRAAGAPSTQGARKGQTERVRAPSTSAPTASSRSPTSPATSRSRAEAEPSARSKPSRPRAADRPTMRARCCAGASRHHRARDAGGGAHTVSRGRRAPAQQPPQRRRLGGDQGRRSRRHTRHGQINLGQHQRAGHQRSADARNRQRLGANGQRRPHRQRAIDLGQH